MTFSILGRRYKVKKGRTYTGIVERVDFPNKGIVIVNEQSEEGGE